MTLQFCVSNRHVAWLALAALLSACSGGGGGDDGVVPPPPPPTIDLQVSGKVTFDRVPLNPVTNGLDYTAIVARPAREVRVQALDAASGAVLDEADADANGDYIVTVPSGAQIRIRARAQMVKSGAPGWDFRVVDNTAGSALYVLDSVSFGSGSSNSTRNLHAASGWSGAAYTATRAAAPFAMLDDIFNAKALILSADPVAVFPALMVNWSVDNAPVAGNESIGEISSTFFRHALDDQLEIFVLGLANNDTDEYDSHVIAHEWGHYMEDAFARSDSVGGSHGSGDRLDPRVAFGEGFGNAFSGMVLNDAEYRDSQGNQQSFGFRNSLEENNNPNAGWFSEGSIESILYDLFDASNEARDSITLGFAPLYAVMTGEQRLTELFTTIFTFIPALKAAQPALAANIDALVQAQSMQSTTMDERGSTETNNAGSAADVLPIYTTLTVDGGAVNVCSINTFGTVNKLSNRRFVEFEVMTTGVHSITVQGPAGSDPDLVLYRRLLLTVGDGLGATENVTMSLASGRFLLEVYEYTNTTDAPRGRTCLDVTVNRQ